MHFTLGKGEDACEKNPGNVYPYIEPIHDIAQPQTVNELKVTELEVRLESSLESSKVLERKIEEIVTASKAEQLRLPARLHNATCNKSPHSIKAPPISPGKFPKNFPNTRGEFEHLTRERYEGILNEYRVEHSGVGDIGDKREMLRAFLGIPMEMIKK